MLLGNIENENQLISKRQKEFILTPKLALKRVETRVKEGGHNIPEKIILRRYESGLNNFFKIYKFLVDEWMFIDNSGEPYEIIGEGNQILTEIHNKNVWSKLNSKYGK